MSKYILHFSLWQVQYTQLMTNTASFNACPLNFRLWNVTL